MRFSTISKPVYTLYMYFDGHGMLQIFTLSFWIMDRVEGVEDTSYILLRYYG